MCSLNLHAFSSLYDFLISIMDSTFTFVKWPLKLFQFFILFKLFTPSSFNSKVDSKYPNVTFLFFRCFHCSLSAIFIYKALDQINHPSYHYVI